MFPVDKHEVTGQGSRTNIMADPKPTHVVTIPLAGAVHISVVADNSKAALGAALVRISDVFQYDGIEVEAIKAEDAFEADVVSGTDWKAECDRLRGHNASLTEGLALANAERRDLRAEILRVRGESAERAGQSEVNPDTPLPHEITRGGLTIATSRPIGDDEMTAIFIVDGEPTGQCWASQDLPVAGDFIVGDAIGLDGADVYLVVTRLWAAALLVQISCVHHERA
jgi:hypothetical protein